MDRGGPLEIVVDDDRLAGVWANDFRLTRSSHEVTLDFVRLDHSRRRARGGILVARVAVSTLLLSRLAEELRREWERYTRGQLPEDVVGEEDEEG